jgi:hypothetical protein
LQGQALSLTSLLQIVQDSKFPLKRARGKRMVSSTSKQPARGRYISARGCTSLGGMCNLPSSSCLSIEVSLCGANRSEDYPSKGNLRSIARAAKNPENGEIGEKSGRNDRKTEREWKV